MRVIGLEEASRNDYDSRLQLPICGPLRPPGKEDPAQKLSGSRRKPAEVRPRLLDQFHSGKAVRDSPCDRRRPRVRPNLPEDSARNNDL